MLELVEITVGYEKQLNGCDCCEDFEAPYYVTPDGTKWDYVEDMYLYMLNQKGVIVEFK